MSDKKIDEMNFFEKADLLRAIAVLPALTIMVFIRARIGFRVAKPIYLMLFFFGMLAVGFFAPASTKPHPALLVVYAFAMLGAGLWQRWARWKEICQGQMWHTFSPGISYLEALPWPPFMRFGRRINRFVEPPLLVLAGFLIAAFLCNILGVWIMLASMFLFIFEHAIYERGLAHDLDVMDGLITSKAQAEVAEFFQQNPEGPMRTLEETEGLPTGLAPDIHRQVESRRARQAKAPDNFLQPS